MAEAKTEKDAAPILPVAPGPHIEAARTTRAVMLDVLIALAPAIGMGLYVFRGYAAMQIGVCVVSCVAFETIWQAARGRRQTVGDLSAAVTGLILALSIPWTAPWYVGVIGSGVAILVAKMFFGGLGSNIFNPAMAGRAFLQACFAGEMTTYVLAGQGLPSQGPPGAVQAAVKAGAEVITQATPLAAGKFEQAAFALRHLAVGNVNGSIGETSAIACLLGGLYLIVRRSASWRVPVGMLAAAGVVAAIHQLADPDAALKVGHHLLGGAMLFGAFFIATDPATSPISNRGLWIYAVGIGVLVMLIRLFANVPEGVMYAVLVMNMTVPLIDRLTVPRPVGGPAPEAKPA